MPAQALEYMNKQGGLPVAARYLARAVALPPSNTSWYMGLSNGAAGLCECLSSAISCVYVYVYGAIPA